ncbi:MAG: tetratricopeptide repeat protein [Phycisphaerae bacterium]|nr:tetratricopeptide repeat protein [Phycisphaerae bacterium]
MANAHNQYDQTKEAAKWWRESLEWAPGRVNARRGLAMIAMKEGDYLKAAEMWGLIRQGNARIPDANGRYGEALLEMGKPAEAIEPLEREVRISPRNAEYHFLLGRAHLQLNQYAKAAKYYEKAHEIQPRDSKTCYGLSVAYARSEQADKAGRMLEKFKSLRAEEDASLSQRRKTSFNRDWTIQTLARTLTGAGIVYDRNRESKKAEKLWRRASRLNPKARICRHELASLYVRQGRTNEAIEICLHLQKTYPNVADYHMRAGLLYARLKQWDLAETALKKAVELDPNNMQIKEAYKRVQERQ